jgi:outer membrane protein OmpA-like peptidoglycan-associated protein
MPGGFGKSDLWYSDFKDNQWQKPVNLGAAINTEERETFPYIFENEVLFFASDGRPGLGGLDLYYCSPTIDLYFEPQALSYPINTRYDDFGMYLNDDFKSGYISSNRPVGNGRDDIYYFNCKKSILNIIQKGTVYDYNTNLPVSNSKVFLLDKFYNELDSMISDSKGGYSFNLTQKLSQFKIGAKERRKFYDRVVTVDTFKFNNNKDIYLYPKYRMIVNVIDSIKNTPLSNVKVFTIFNSKASEFELTDMYGDLNLLLKNKKMRDTINMVFKIEKEGYKTKLIPKYFILDTNIIVRCNFNLALRKEISYALEIFDENGNLVDADVEVVDNKDNKSIYKFNTKEKNKMPLQLKSGENYGISVAAEGYLFQSENLDIPDDAEYNIVKRIVLKKLSKGSNIVLNNVFFDVAKATLRPTSINELDRLYNVLLSNPSMKIELSGHTDNQGSKVLNQKLSLARANAVVDYLISKGISGDRLVSKGYGYDKPVASNNTEEGRQLNRRTELKILEIN